VGQSYSLEDDIVSQLGMKLFVFTNSVTLVLILSPLIVVHIVTLYLFQDPV
jgi:hypothetical protein